MSSRLRLPLYVTAVASAAAVVTVGVSLADTSHPSPIKTGHTPPRLAALADRSFSVLARAHASGDAPGSAAVVALAQGSFSASVSQASNGDVCLTTNDPAEGEGISCGPPREVDTQGLAMSSVTHGGTRRITVLVPNGVTAVTFASPTQTVSVPVTNNVATSTLTGLTEESFTSPAGEKEIFSIPKLPFPLAG